VPVPRKIIEAKSILEISPNLGAHDRSHAASKKRTYMSTTPTQRSNMRQTGASNAETFGRFEFRCQYRQAKARRSLWIAAALRTKIVAMTSMTIADVLIVSAAAGLSVCTQAPQSHTA
jgi:hypothetical protein